MSERGHYGSVRVGQIAPPVTTVYVERERSTVARILGVIVVIGSVGSALWTRHQSRQIEQLYKTTGLPYQSFTSSLRQGAGSTLRGLAERVRPQGRNAK